LDKGEISSAKEEEFLEHLKNIHEEVRKHIIKMNTQYKAKENVNRRYKKFQIRGMVHLRKECFQVGTYNKLKMKKLGPCKIVKRYDFRNAYEVEFPIKVNIFPVFNISYLIEYYEGGDRDEVAEV